MFLVIEVCFFFFFLTTNFVVIFLSKYNSFGAAVGEFFFLKLLYSYSEKKKFGLIFNLEISLFLGALQKRSKKSPKRAPEKNNPNFRYLIENGSPV